MSRKATKRPHRILRTRGQRIAWTNTSRLPDEQVIEAMKFVAVEADLDAVVIHWKKDGGRRRSYGMAYPEIPYIANVADLYRRRPTIIAWRYLITLTDQQHEEITPRIVNTLAHEAKHIEQFRLDQRPSETPCIAFGAWVADRWVGR